MAHGSPIPGQVPTTTSTASSTSTSAAQNFDLRWVPDPGGSGLLVQEEFFDGRWAQTGEVRNPVPDSGDGSAATPRTQFESERQLDLAQAQATLQQAQAALKNAQTSRDQLAIQKAQVAVDKARLAFDEAQAKITNQLASDTLKASIAATKQRLEEIELEARLAFEAEDQLLTRRLEAEKEMLTLRLDNDFRELLFSEIGAERRTLIQEQGETRRLAAELQGKDPFRQASLLGGQAQRGRTPAQRFGQENQAFLNQPLPQANFGGAFPTGGAGTGDPAVRAATLAALQQQLTGAQQRPLQPQAPVGLAQGGTFSMHGPPQSFFVGEVGGRIIPGITEIMTVGGGRTTVTPLAGGFQTGGTVLAEGTIVRVDNPFLTRDNWYVVRDGKLVKLDARAVPQGDPDSLADQTITVQEFESLSVTMGLNRSLSRDETVALLTGQSPTPAPTPEPAPIPAPIPAPAPGEPDQVRDIPIVEPPIIGEPAPTPAPATSSPGSLVEGDIINIAGQPVAGDQSTEFRGNWYVVQDGKLRFIDGAAVRNLGLVADQTVDDAGFAAIRTTMGFGSFINATEAETIFAPTGEPPVVAPPAPLPEREPDPVGIIGGTPGPAILPPGPTGPTQQDILAGLQALAPGFAGLSQFVPRTQEGPFGGTQAMRDFFSFQGQNLVQDPFSGQFRPFLPGLPEGTTPQSLLNAPTSFGAPVVNQGAFNLQNLSTLGFDPALVRLGGQEDIFYRDPTTGELRQFGTPDIFEQSGFNLQDVFNISPTGQNFNFGAPITSPLPLDPNSNTVGPFRTPLIDPLTGALLFDPFQNASSLLQLLQENPTSFNNLLSSFGTAGLDPTGFQSRLDLATPTGRLDNPFRIGFTGTRL
ncbi:MAG: hypothetical protein V3U27_21350 [Candidatus Tectomicrobia bacterium]